MGITVSSKQVGAAVIVAVMLSVLGAKAWSDKCAQQYRDKKPTVIERTIPVHLSPSNTTMRPCCQQTPVYGAQGCTTQIGTISSNGRILPLFQTTIPSRQWRYMYHTLTDSRLPMKIAVYSKGRDCLSCTVGCEELYQDDEVQVPALGTDNWTVYLYNRY